MSVPSKVLKTKKGTMQKIKANRKVNDFSFWVFRLWFQSDVGIHICHVRHYENANQSSDVTRLRQEFRQWFCSFHRWNVSHRTPSCSQALQFQIRAGCNDSMGMNLNTRAEFYIIGWRSDKTSPLGEEKIQLQTHTDSIGDLRWAIGGISHLGCYIQNRLKSSLKS